VECYYVLGRLQPYYRTVIALNTLSSKQYDFRFSSAAFSLQEFVLLSMIIGSRWLISAKAYNSNYFLSRLGLDEEATVGSSSHVGVVRVNVSMVLRDNSMSYGFYVRN